MGVQRVGHDWATELTDWLRHKCNNCKRSGTCCQVPIFFHHLVPKLCLVTQSCPTLCDPMDCSLPGYSVHGIVQTRILKWFAISLSNITYIHSFFRLFSCIGHYRVWSRVPCAIHYVFFVFCFLNFTILYWFCHISKWIRHRYTCVPHPEPSSLLPPHTIPLGRPIAPAPSIQYHASNLDWRLVSYMIYTMFLFIIYFIYSSVYMSTSPSQFIPSHFLPW